MTQKKVTRKASKARPAKIKKSLVTKHAPRLGANHNETMLAV